MNKQRLSILVIEGDESLARLFADVFALHNWDTDSFCDRASSTQALSGNKRYDIIFTSYRVPGTDGIQLARLIRNLDHRKDTPLVLVTGSLGLEREALAAGVNEVLKKPLDMQTLVGAVTKHVSNSG